MAHAEGFTTSEDAVDIPSAFETDTSDGTSKKKKSGLFAVRAVEGQRPPAAAELRRAEPPKSLGEAVRFALEKDKKAKEKTTGDSGFPQTLGTEAVMVRETGPDATSREQSQDAAAQVIEERSESVSVEAKDIETRNPDLPDIAAVAADARVLHEMQEEIRSGGHETVEAALDEAAETVEHSINAAESSEPATGRAEADSEDKPEASAQTAAGGPLASPATPNAAGNVPPAAANMPPNSPNGPPAPPFGGNFNQPPGNPNGPPPPPGPPGPPGQPNSGIPNPNNYGYTPQNNPNTAAATYAYNPNASPDMVSESDADYRAQRAGWRGLIAGTLVGYIFGRHRGKNIGRRETEKKFEPVRKKFENQLDDLRWNISAKESRIRSLAHDKAESMQKTSERERLIETLIRPAHEQPVTGEQKPGTEYKAELGVAVGAPLLAAAELYNRATAEKSDPAKTTEILISDRQRAPVAGRAEQMNTKELMSVAEKIKIEGISLKDMAEVGTLSEPALRRVIGAYMEGRNVKEALARETDEKELQFERDPKLRHARGTGGGGNGTGSGGLMAAGHIAVAASAPGLDPGNSDDTKSQDAAKPDTRKKETATVAATAVAVILAVTFLIWATG